MSDGFVKVASIKEIPQGILKTFDVRGKPVLLTNVAGRIFAIGAICNHRQWNLSEGYLEGEYVVCKGHGAKWSLKTGQGAFRRPLPPEPIYEVKIEGDSILVRI